MAVLTSYWPVDILVAFLTLISLVYLYHTRNYNYWKSRGVPYVSPHWLLGSFYCAIAKTKSWHEYLCLLHNDYKECGYVGLYLYNVPSFLILDLNLVEKVLVEDFSNFHDRPSPFSKFQEPMSMTLFHMKGQLWRIVRGLLSPAFASNKVKGMYQQMFSSIDSITLEIEKHAVDGSPIDLEQLMFVYVTKVIASCTFGVEMHIDSPLWEKFEQVVNLITTTKFWGIVKQIFVIGFPAVAKFFGIKLIQYSVENFFMNFTKATIKLREQNAVTRNDFLQLMMELKHQEKTKGKHFLYGLVQENREKTPPSMSTSKDVLKRETLFEYNGEIFSDNTIASLLFNFNAAGIKPTQETISFALFEIAKDESIQCKLQSEIDACVKRQGGLNFDAIRKMTYLDQVLQETLRMYTVNPVIMREVTKDYRVPGTDVVLEKGTIVMIPVGAIHLDAQVYPSPKRFKPERFLGNKYKPSVSFMPFGHGPRICVAVKFAVVTMKVCLAKILSKYSVRLNDGKLKSPNIDEGEFFLKTKDGMWLLFSDRNLIV